MNITLADLLDNNKGLFFNFHDEKGNKVSGWLHSIKGDKVTMAYETGDGVKFYTVKASEVTLHKDSGYRRLASANFLNVKQLKLDSRKSIDEQLMFSIGKDSLMFESGAYQLLKQFANEGQPASFSFGVTDGGGLVILPMCKGDGQYVIPEETLSIEDDFTHILEILQKNGMRTEEYLEFSKNKTKLARIPFTTAYSMSTGENFVPYLRFTLNSTFGNDFENWFLIQLKKQKLKQRKNKKVNSSDIKSKHGKMLKDILDS